MAVDAVDDMAAWYDAVIREVQHKKVSDWTNPFSCLCARVR